MNWYRAVWKIESGWGRQILSAKSEDHAKGMIKKMYPYADGIGAYLLDDPDDE